MTTPYDDIVADLDVAHIEDAADWAAEALRNCGVARVELTPGDLTRYPITVIGSGGVFVEGGYRMERDYTVALRLRRGSAYSWHPTNSDYTDPTYAAEKWGDGNLHTGVVMSLFLNALRKALAS